MTRSQHHQRPDRVLFSTQHKIRRRVKWFYTTLTIALRFTTGCPSAKATAATRTLPAVHRTRPRLCDSTGAHIHPGTECTACSGRCRCYPRCAANPGGTGSWTPPHPRSPPPGRRLGAARTRTWSARKIRLRLRRGSCRPRQVPWGGAAREEGTPGGSGQPTRTVRGRCELREEAGKQLHASGERKRGAPRGSHVPAGVPSALPAFSSASPARSAERPSPAPQLEMGWKIPNQPPELRSTAFE